jgi:hypothetical protein
LKGKAAFGSWQQENPGLRFALRHRRRQRHHLARQPSESRVQQLTGFGTGAAGADERPRTGDRKVQAMTIKAINPVTGETFASYPEMTDDGVRDAISKGITRFSIGGEQAFPAAPA